MGHKAKESIGNTIVFIRNEQIADLPVY